MKLITTLVALLLIAGCTANKFQVPEDVNSGGTLLTRTSGVSMEPTIPNHSTLVLRKDWDGIKIGDVVAYYPAGSTTALVHRVCAEGIVKEGKVLTWRTRGDNNNFIDPVHVWATTYKGTVITKGMK